MAVIEEAGNGAREKMGRDAYTHIHSLAKKVDN